MKYVLLIVLVLMTNPSWALGFTKVIHQDEIQTKLDQMMPLKRTKYFVTIKVSQPKIALQSGQEALYVEAIIEASALGGLHGKGQIGIAGNIEYRPAEGAFYLQNPTVKKLVLNQVPADIQPKIKKSVEQLVAKALKNYPIYVLDDTDTKQKLAKATIKSIKIEDKQVEITLSLF